VHNFDFYPTALEIKGDKSDDSCNSTQGPLRAKLPQYTMKLTVLVQFKIYNKQFLTVPTVKSLVPVTLKANKTENESCLFKIDAIFFPLLF
jgi:hypothetical protein